MRKAKSSGSPHQSDGGKPSQVAPVPWHGLPLTVQQQILRELNNDYDRNRVKDKTHRAAYAAVCLEWQEYFEGSSANFGKLVLHPSALDEFQKIIQRRQKHRIGDSRRDRGRPRKRCRLAVREDLPVEGHMLYIRHIWLRVELQEYDCNNCKGWNQAKKGLGTIFRRRPPRCRRLVDPREHEQEQCHIYSRPLEAAGCTFNVGEERHRSSSKLDSRSQCSLSK